MDGFSSSFEERASIKRSLWRVRLRRFVSSRRRRKEGERARGEVKALFIPVTFCLFWPAPCLSPVSNDTLGHVLRFHPRSIHSQDRCTRLRHLLMNSPTLSLSLDGLSIRYQASGRRWYVNVESTLSRDYSLRKFNERIPFVRCF